MAEKTTVHLGENSPEEVAFKLMQEIASAESKKLYRGLGTGSTPDRKWILQTYFECRKVVYGGKPALD